MDPEEASESASASEEQQEQERERTTLRDFLDDVCRRHAWKGELRADNGCAADQRPEESHFHKLDSSLKKNTAFVRKLKNFTDGQKDPLRKEMSALNLTKYIGEVASALVEAKLKMTDLPAALEICSFLHQRYVDFAPNLMEAWQKALTLKKDEKGVVVAVANPSKLRVDLRFYAELVAVGVFTLKEGLPFLGQVLTTLITMDKEEHVYISLVLAFCKHCGDDYAGLVPRRIRQLVAKYPDLVGERGVLQSPLLPAERQRNVRQMLLDYFASAGRHLVAEQAELQSVERTNRRILLTKGEVHTERKERLAALQASHTKLLASVEQLADLLDENMPDLPKSDEAGGQDGKKDAGDDLDEAEMGTGEVEASALGALWEDDETKSFYEDLVDLKAFIPAILYKDSGQKKLPGEEEEEEKLGLVEEAETLEEQLMEDVKENDAEEEEEEGEDEEVKPPEIEDDADEPEATGAASGPTQNASHKMLFEAFLARLPTCVSREMIDTAAADFCMQHNTKNNRKKLVKNLFSVHRNRQDLLPFYARLVATLYPCMPEVAVDLAQYLKQDFRWHVRKKDQIKVESKLKVCRFIGEMAKFKMFLKSETLFCLKQLLFDFAHHHIEMACTLMETCGRFLYRTPDSHQRTKIYLEQMIRKKTALSMDSRYSMMIENAFYVVNPPEVPLQAAKTRPPLHEYIRKLLYHDLCRHNTEKVLKQIRKLDWEDKKTAVYAVKCLSAVWNVKYTNVKYAASLLAGLNSYQDWVAPRIVDSILEDVRLQMELNDVRHNQRRVTVVKFLGDLYNYRLVDSPVVFKVLYSLISFGASQTPDEYNTFDPPEHLLRVKLVCVLLDTCGMYFNTGGQKKKLDYFFVFFQRYYWRKRAASFWAPEEGADEAAADGGADGRPKFPFAVAHMVSETLPTLRPKLKLFRSLDEAEAAAAKVQKEMLQAVAEKAPDLKIFLEQADEKKESAGQGGSLQPIAEEGDEDDEEEASQPPRSRSASQMDTRDSQEEDEEEDEDDEDDEDEEEDEYSQEDELTQEEDDDEDIDDDDVEDDEDDEEGMKVEEGMEDLHVPSAPKHIACEEDDDFVNLFDKMLNENITETRTAAAIPRGQQNDIVAPMHVKNKRPSYTADNSNQFQTIGADLAGEEDNTVQFSVLLRKGNKPAYKEVAVPADSEIAQNLQKQEEADRREKERVKQLTLEINERQEEEDLNEAIAAMQRPTLVNVNRDRRGRGYQAPKGAPDADLIFGSKRIVR